MASRVKIETGTAGAHSTAAARPGLLQRKCACGGRCADCDGKKLTVQRAPDKSQSRPPVPASVRETLRSAGRPLDAPTRAFMEPRFGHDFSKVRIHTDAKASESARAVNALAYTLGSDIVFAGGRYAPHSAAGRRLLAHELAHVVQQVGRLQRTSVGVEPKIEVGGVDDEMEREAEAAAQMIEEEETTPVLRRASAARLQRAPAIVGLDDAGPGAHLTGGGKEAELLECVRAGGADPVECDPSAALTWADFKGAPEAGSKYTASTHSGLRQVTVPTQDCAKKVLGKTTGSSIRFQAYMTPGKSWVKPGYKYAGDPAKNGCAAFVSQCEKAFDKLAAAGQTGWWSLSSDADPNCPAGITARGDKAEKKEECATIVGSDCADMWQAEAERLLRHEQGHYDITCVLAKKANVALAAGGDLTKLNKAVNAKVASTQRSYDNETNHSCKGAQQRAWDDAIADDLPKVTVP